MNIFAIGDIHGCLNQLVFLQKKILNYPKFKKNEDLLVYLGDYIDRGPNSKGVINQAITLQKENIKSIFLMGNHEQVMIDFLFDIYILYNVKLTFELNVVSASSSM